MMQRDTRLHISMKKRNVRFIFTYFDSSSQCICTQEDTGAELNIEEQHWISIGIFPNVCSGNSYIHCHCRETSNTASKNVLIEYCIGQTNSRQNGELFKSKLYGDSLLLLNIGHNMLTSQRVHKHQHRKRRNKCRVDRSNEILSDYCDGQNCKTKAKKKKCDRSYSSVTELANSSTRSQKTALNPGITDYHCMEVTKKRTINQSAHKH